jgi:hypothetical protein
MGLGVAIAEGMIGNDIEAAAQHGSEVVVHGRE